ncbi:segregation/condensation protein A [Paenibacillus sp.]|uniref:segregation and condensation protein A n=1 Tax=Paenibacillus sp. TaxID=58172 RepID=UPI002D3F1B9E|nr:segregation/condensation protein A [Paenibacillus sp.]HZG55430.1 segregation/condensation protein A [Paenibacillus sp.]
MSVTYKLPSFEGPLDLLLHLIDKAEVDITNIPISEITDQYMEYVSLMEELELEVASEFLVMAATLLSIKSKMLLPKPPVIDLDLDYEENAEDTLEELVHKLIEYRKYKSIAEHLRDKELEQSLVYSREPVDLSPYAVEEPRNPVEGLETFDLLLAFQKALRRVANRNVVAKIRRDEVSIKDRIRDVLRYLRMEGGRLLFSRLFDESSTRDELVVSFLALLELMKMKKITCYQHGRFEDIVIQAKEGANIDDEEELERMEIDH